MLRMPKQPPYCYICENNYEGKFEELHYCYCGSAVCDKCIGSVSKDDKTWICPSCKAELDIEGTRLFREA